MRVPRTRARSCSMSIAPIRLLLEVQLPTSKSQFPNLASWELVLGSWDLPCAQLRLRVVRRVDVEDVERPFEIDLHDGRTGRPREVVHFPRQRNKPTGLERLARVTVQRVSHAHM